MSRNFRVRKTVHRFEKTVADGLFSYGKKDLKDALSRLGIGDGDTLLVHASFRNVNGFQGAPKEIVDALLEVVGEEGNLIMVSLPFTTSAYEYLKDNPVFDVDRTISKMGIVSETFRRRNGVLRSLHPTHSVLAYGKDAAWIVKDHEKSLFPCGEDTPFGKLRALNGKVLFFDVPFGNFTFIHYLEDLIKERVSIPLYRKELMPARIRNSSGEESLIHTCVFSEESRRSLDPGILERALARNGMLKASRIGLTRLILVGCEDAVGCTNEMLDSDTYFYRKEDILRKPSFLRNMILLWRSLLDGDLAKVYLSGRRNHGGEAALHLDAAVRWLCRAQDVSGDGGVARSYSLVYNREYGRKGWTPSYPETTGYIIPTMFDYARCVGSEEISERAIRMADWECRIQMDCGAVQGGTVWHPPTPAIFNTGQVIFGWLRAYKETGDEEYYRCANKAGEYLVSQQDEDGAWRRNLSAYTSPSMPYYLYNTRTAWALLELSLVRGDRVFRDAAVNNVEFSIQRQAENGYFDNNCLTDPSRSLLHTIAYCLRGILETGVILKRNHYIERVMVSADAILKRMRGDGSFPGRFHPDWEPAVSWTCTTANSQMSIVLGRLYAITGTKRYLEGMRRANVFQKGIQILCVGNPDLYGSFTGSYPVHGSYGKYELLNWAVKFFVDSLMLEKEIDENRKLLLDLHEM